MRLLILSDTHGNYPLAVKALEEAGQVDQIIHLGDEFEDACMIEAILGSPLIKVPGNCDLGVDDARTITMTFDGSRIFMTHGDRYQVKSGLARLHKKATAEQAGIVLYGHTHVAAITEIDGILFVNPGCLDNKCSTPSYAILTITHGKVVAEICPINP
jgi:putative phosphoesterase